MRHSPELEQVEEIIETRMKIDGQTLHHETFGFQDVWKISGPSVTGDIRYYMYKLGQIETRVHKELIPQNEVQIVLDILSEIESGKIKFIDNQIIRL